MEILSTAISNFNQIFVKINKSLLLSDNFVENLLLRDIIITKGGDFTNIKLSEQLIKHRLKSGLSRQQVADKLGCTTSAICQWENGKRQPDADTLIQLIHIYNISNLNEFFGEKSEIHTSITNAEKMLLSLYREAPYECKNIVNLILKNYGRK